MEPYLADFIYNKKIPKIIRTITVIIIAGFLITLGLLCGFGSPMLWGKIFGFIISAVFLITGVYIIFKIYKN